MSGQPNSSEAQSKMWSCATLSEGVEHVAKACALEDDDEDYLLKKLQEADPTFAGARYC